MFKIPRNSPFCNKNVSQSWSRKNWRGDFDVSKTKEHLCVLTSGWHNNPKINWMMIWSVCSGFSLCKFAVCVHLINCVNFRLSLKPTALPITTEKYNRELQKYNSIKSKSWRKSVIMNSYNNQFTQFVSSSTYNDFTFTPSPLTSISDCAYESEDNMKREATEGLLTFLNGENSANASDNRIENKMRSIDLA